MASNVISDTVPWNKKYPIAKSDKKISALILTIFIWTSIVEHNYCRIM